MYIDRVRGVDQFEYMQVMIDEQNHLKIDLKEGNNVMYMYVCILPNSNSENRTRTNRTHIYVCYDEH